VFTYYQLGEWLPFEDAHFVRSDKIKTPMDHGIVAFSDYSEAKGFTASVPTSVQGNMLKSQGVAAHRGRAGREALKE